MDIQQEILGVDSAGRCDFSLPPPSACYDAPLSAGTPITITPPTNFNRAFFSYAVGTNVWVTFDGSVPAVPASAGATTQELRPSVRQITLDGKTTIKAVSDVASFINIRYDVSK